MTVIFSKDQPFRVSLKNSCNEKPLKIGVTEAGEIKMRAGKKVVPGNINFMRGLNNTLVSISLEKTTIPRSLNTRGVICVIKS